MRQLKFRAWDTKTNKFVATDFHILGEVTCFNLIEQYIFANMCGAETSLERLNDIVIMQFTGQKDKNEKDIYEGDIVQVLDENNVFEVKFGKVEREVVGFDTEMIHYVELNTFFFEQEGRPYFSITENHLGKHDLEDTLVIGNIFENKELLN